MSFVRRNLLTTPGYSPYCGQDHCNDYGDRVGCLGTPDDRYIMRFDDIGEDPILWCAFCGPMAHSLNDVLTGALETRGQEFLVDFEQAVKDASEAVIKS